MSARTGHRAGEGRAGPRQSLGPGASRSGPACVGLRGRVATESHRRIDVASYGIGDANRHNHGELPVVLAGGGNGTLAGGRHLVYPRSTPLCNLFTSLLERMGVPEPAPGDATGRLTDLG